MDRHETTRRSFARQAGRHGLSPTFAASAALRRIADGLGGATTGRILDLACGEGLVAAALAPAAALLAGVDVTPEMLERARARCRGAGPGHARFLRGAVEALPFAAGAFDAAVSRLGLHHFRDPDAVLREAHRVLVPGGRLVVVDLVASENPADATVHDALEKLRDPSHERLLPASELGARIRAAGFTVASESGWTVERAFGEWAAIVDDERRTAPLREVMTHLARAGHRLGIDLHERGGVPCFTHTFRLVAATRP